MLLASERVHALALACVWLTRPLGPNAAKRWLVSSISPGWVTLSLANHRFCSQKEQFQCQGAKQHTINETVIGKLAIHRGSMNLSFTDHRFGR